MDKKFVKKKKKKTYLKITKYKNCTQICDIHIRKSTSSELKIENPQM